MMSCGRWAMDFGSFGVSDELLGTVVPILVYWAYSGVYVLFGSSEKYRLHSRKEENVKNLVSKQTVVKGVLLQQTIQAAVAIILFKVYMLSLWSISLHGLISFLLTTLILLLLEYYS